MDPVADMLTIIRNGYMAGLVEVSCRKSKLKLALAKILEKHRYIASVKQEDGFLKIKLAYEDKKPALTAVKRISKPGLHVYYNVDRLKKERSWHAVKIVSTPKGLMTDREAIAKNVGGEVIAVIS